MRKSVVVEMFNCEWEGAGLEGDPSRGRRGVRRDWMQQPDALGVSLRGCHMWHLPLWAFFTS